jgi:hypothetical protein
MIHWAMGNAGMHGAGCPLGQVQRARGGAMMGRRRDTRGGGGQHGVRGGMLTQGGIDAEGRAVDAA